LNSIELETIDELSKGKSVLHINANAEIEGKKIPGIVVMKGRSAAILIVYVYVIKGKHHESTVILSTPRLATGCSDFFEIPSGFVHEDGSFMGSMCNTLHEKLGLNIQEDPLIDMSFEIHGKKKPIYLSPGASDEAVTYFLLRKFIDETQYHDLQKLCQTQTEGQVKCLLIPLKDIFEKSDDSKSWIAHQLYENWKTHQIRKLKKQNAAKKKNLKKK